MTEHLLLADIVERILAAPPRPAHEIAAARRERIGAPPVAEGVEPRAADPPRGRHWSDARGHRRPVMGFTLIEVLVVIVVITVLATLVAPNVFRHVGSAKEATAKTQMEMLGSAVDAYRLDNDEYPTTEQGLAALRARPQAGPQPRSWRGPYLRRDVPLDPWGRPYVYRMPGIANPEGYDLLTLGRDGREGGEGEDADVLGWK
ncbi:type II secretion system major pseudopilin GspG [Longimicrobium sp.]|uniref:type II secretion system major pseudopilin GspG n=1 Tax=Longimicrobium sp. TaxID=2029185 RepID=UPI002CA08C51|nr:type II secretion system major pseudopilin GspG [Longimicrobium sp.]HSU15698.1 type II secretion system major pseudopilin GspG [Longimicrobium sp.]